IWQWRLDRLAQADRTVRSPFFVRGMEDLIRHPHMAGYPEDLVKWLQLEEHYDKFGDICLVSTNGRMLLSVNERPDPLDMADTRAIEESIKAHQAVLSEIYRSRSGRIYVDAVAPVVDVKGKPLA